MKKRWNWAVWLGFLFCVAALPSYFLLVRFPATRDFPWVNLLMFAAGLFLLGMGLRRAFRDSGRYGGKIAGPILGTLSLLLAGFFCFVIFYGTKQLPKSAGAPGAGQRLPEFALQDSDNQTATLASLLAAPLSVSSRPPKAVLLIFYRGYW
jgi:hypothetical protein